MIPLDDLILLDTNIILQFIRKNRVGQQLESDYQFRSRPNCSLISCVTKGEMYALAMKFGWGEEKKAYLSRQLEKLTVIDLNLVGIIDNYAQIDYFSEKLMKPARPMGQNDLWIAATAATLGVCLMTTDDDFDHLHPKYIHRIKIDAKTGKTIV
ncbi:MAG: hypothetical protein DRR16_09075 [Candidatus Parabeggiatoa sp. nov. 3]|nr:MAG: hypothetical protein DRR00_15020 [Gammaproteobacteria bacterium]RKZ65943.1 MAG: hypothetical protein DRQ99_11225 [Gammaproteobacteria bacterium]RKZ86665.1 MAG: hypothetical protein DRR16_09075 [Gammaproteobacteria bacterium]HEW97483.1 type II toxin-antitoxin system VapC family toxin [Beggiatoa sp.]